MLEAAGIYLLLLAFACLAGYPAVRTLAQGVPAGSRIALTPLLGAGIIALVEWWTHVFVPLGGRLALVGLAPVALGAALFLHDVAKGRIAAPRMPQLAWAAMAAVASAMVLLPFAMFHRATSFGIMNNDAFWYTQADWRVQHYAYFVTAAQMGSKLARVTAGAQRYGLDYLSLLLQAVTGLRSWQTVHIVGAFGALLISLAAGLFARTARLWWPMALLAALLASANHFVYRLYLDAFLAFLFGLAYLMALCWFMALPAGGGAKRRAVLLAVLAASLMVFYFDLLPVAAVVLLATILTGRLRLARLRTAALAAVPAFLLTAPMALVLPAYLRSLAAATNPVKYFDFSRPWQTMEMLLGTMDVYQMRTGAGGNLLQLAGSVAVLALMLSAVLNLRKLPRALRAHAAVAAVLGLLFAYVLFVQKMEYSAHRLFAILAAFAPALLLAPLSRRVWRARTPHTAFIATAVVIAVAGVAYPDAALMSALAASPIHVTQDEADIGSQWISQLPRDSCVLIDTDDDQQIFYPHYMYWEAVYGAQGDESRVLFPHHKWAYLTYGARTEKIDPDACAYTLMRRAPGGTEGNLKVLRSNDRYELIAAPPLTYRFDQGFYGMERDGNTTWRWMRQDGRIVIAARHGDGVLQGEVMGNPALTPLKVTLSVNGAAVTYDVGAPRSPIRFRLPLVPGSNTLTVHSSADPKPPNVQDSRPMSVALVNFAITPAN